MLVGFLLLLGSIAIYIIRIYKSNLANTEDCEESNTKTINELENDDDINCFCSKQTITNLITSEEFGDVCSDYFYLIAIKQLIIIFISMLLFLVNELIELVFVKLSKFSRHKYLTTKMVN